MFGTILTVSTITNMFDEGVNLRNASWLALGLLFLDEDGLSASFEQLTDEKTTQLGVDRKIQEKYNNERPALNAFTQSFINEVIKDGKFDEEKQAAYRTALRNEFAPETVQVAELITKRAFPKAK
jgi:hypothetical protein